MDKKRLMVLDWTRKVHQLEYAHCYESMLYANLNNVIGILTLIITSTVAATYQFPGLSLKDYQNLPAILKQDYFVATFSSITVIFTAILTLLRPGEKAEKHRVLGIEYEKIRHEFEKIQTYDISDFSFEYRADQNKLRWDSLDTIYVTRYNYSRAKKKVKDFKKYPEELSFY
jgi:hypothetical protein